ncbi:MAG: inositol monophosphatase [Saprospiraceae bacterium]|nr:inositol monophosphatase [Saprospiraceae bacterium]
MLDLTDIIPSVRDLVNRVAGFISSQVNQVSMAQIEEKSKNSLVSFVDKQAEIRLVEGLRNIIPGSTFLTEEGTVEQQKGEWRWIIDPLDGTTNFLHGIPVFAISVALQFRGTTALGIVHEIGQNEQFYAWEQGGAWCNGRPIRVAAASSMDQALIATGFPYYDYKRIAGYLDVLESLMRDTRGVRRCGSAAVDLAYVAAGRYNAFFEYSLHPWDVAAGAFIVLEAGGVVTDFKGENNFLFGKEVIAGGAIIHACLLETIQSAFFR